MNTPLRLWLAGMAATLVPPVLKLVLHARYFFTTLEAQTVAWILLMVFLLAVLAVFVVGLPLFLLLRRLGWLGWRQAALTGLALGVLPVLATGWPRSYEATSYSAGQNWHGHYVDTYVNGIPTLHAWLVYGENIAVGGIEGVLGALVFYAVWRRLEPVRAA